MKRGRYSKYIRPISIIIDSCLLIILFPYFFKGLDINFQWFGIYLVAIWIIISFFTKFYEIYRFTTPVNILSKTAKQMTLFLLLIIAFFPFYKTAIFSGYATATYVLVVLFGVVLLKSLAFYYIKKYRLLTGNNFRNVVIIGHTEESKDLKNIFEKRPDYGYNFKGFFSDRKTGEGVLGKIDEIKNYVFENKIDEIYCSINEISNEKHKELVAFADENDIIIKFIPDSKAIFSKKLNNRLLRVISSFIAKKIAIR